MIREYLVRLGKEWYRSTVTEETDMPDPLDKFLYHEGDLEITYPDGTHVPSGTSIAPEDDSEGVSGVTDESD